jgi:hypothetical protein
MHSNRGSNQWVRIPNPCILHKNTILALLRSGSGLGQIARKIEVSPKALRAFLADEHIDVPKHFVPNACHRNRKLVLEMGMSGCSLNEIARRIKTNGRHVRKFLDSQGVKREYLTNYGGSRSPGWNGGRTNSRGYVKIHMPSHPHAQNGYVLEHRLVMEKMIGRLLDASEVVHHRNGVKDDNRPENLQLFSENKDHLAHELKGRIPKWSPEGLVRMKAGVDRSSKNRRGKTWWHWREKLKRGVQPSRVRSTRLQASLQKSAQPLSQTESQPSQARAKS